jgi:hypothetical protein
MNFDRWMDDPRGGAAINLADPELKQRQNHILKQAFDALEPDARALMARIGMLNGAVGLDVLGAEPSAARSAGGGAGATQRVLGP